MVLDCLEIMYYNKHFKDKYQRDKETNVFGVYEDLETGSVLLLLTSEPSRFQMRPRLTSPSPSPCISIYTWVCTFGSLVVADFHNSLTSAVRYLSRLLSAMEYRILHIAPDDPTTVCEQNN